MEIRHQSDLYGSYLLIPAESLDHNKYAFKMLEKNRIKGILTCKERIEDGHYYLHVDITGKKNLCQEYQEKEMNLEEMTCLFQSLTAILERSREYLLTEKMLIFEPELIYRDIEDGSYSVIALPWERDESFPLRKLAEFLLEKMNHLDENGISAACHFYRQQSQPQFSIYLFLTVLEKENILSRQKNIDTEQKEKLMEDEAKNEEESAFYPIEQIDEEKDLSQESSSKILICCMILSFLTFIFSFLPFVEKNQKISCFALSVILFLFGGIHRFLSRKKAKIDYCKIDKEATGLIEIGEETVFFQESDIKDSIKLQWKEGGRKKTVEVDTLPFTIGKKKGQVSLQLSDSSVSRIHCRIIEQEGRPVLVDMGSTNGTYLNGIRVEKGEMLEIVKNDEILIGKVKILVV